MEGGPAWNFREDTGGIIDQCKVEQAWGRGGVGYCVLNLPEQQETPECGGVGVRTMAGL